MLKSVEKHLKGLDIAGFSSLLRQGLIGLEKESLRVANDGGIAKTRHPAVLGSPLTHPWVTTDYSEALIELITPPFADRLEALEFLSDLQTYVYRHLQDETLWATSMPCVLSGGDNIPIAQYGESNPARMKHIYRVGLGHRYGRVMQVIAGVHFNYSPAEDFWPCYQELLGDAGRELRRFKDKHFMGLVRNIQRLGWLVPYLFGASPAVCRSFFAGKTSRLSRFDDSTYYEPYATSLRMGDIGYQNRREQGAGVKACYDSLGAYVNSLTHAIETPAPLWEKIGVKVDGEYRQLNANILQIENEYYSSVRPKQILEGLEKPVLALRDRGIRYIELRSLDVNAYHPLGVDESQIRVIEALMLFCLLAESPSIGMQERWEIDRNLEKIAHRGRDPEFRLMRHGRGIPIRDWGAEVIDGLLSVCDVLDGDQGAAPYRAAVLAQREKVNDPDATPSATMLRDMREHGEGFYGFARRMSAKHFKYFTERTLSTERMAAFEAEAAASWRRHAALEAGDAQDFDTFLAEYYTQA